MGRKIEKGISDMKGHILQEYDTKLDNKRRCVIHGIPAFDRYHVIVYEDGKIEMTPRVLARPEELSENTLRMIYSSVKNLKEGKVGSEINLKKYKHLLKEDM